MDEDELLHTVTHVYSALGHELRVRILYALFSSQSPLGYNELMREVGKVDSGRFNYHLSELRDTFVVRSEHGYELNLQGQRLMSSVVAGRYMGEEVDYSADLERPCPACDDGGLDLVQTGAMPEVVCDTCDLVYDRYGPFPLSAWESHDEEGIRHGMWQRLVSGINLALEDVCYDCYSPLERSPHRKEDDLPALYYPERNLEYIALFDCGTCTNYLPIPYSVLAWFDPQVRSFLAENDIDAATTPGWMIDHVVDELEVTVSSEEPFRVGVSFTIGEDSCRVLFDDEHRVTSVIV